MKMLGGRAGELAVEPGDTGLHLIKIRQRSKVTRRHIRLHRLADLGPHMGRMLRLDDGGLHRGILGKMQEVVPDLRPARCNRSDDFDLKHPLEQGQSQIRPDIYPVHPLTPVTRRADIMRHGSVLIELSVDRRAVQVGSGIEFPITRNLMNVIDPRRATGE